MVKQAPLMSAGPSLPSLAFLASYVFARVRPEHVHGAAQANGFSFPSGHSSASMVAYAMLAYLAVRLLPRAWQVPAALARQ